MGLRGYGIAVGLGYLLGRPEGRAGVAMLGRRATQLIGRPEIVRLQERGKALASDRVQSVKQKITARSADADKSAGTATGPSRRWRTRAGRHRFSRSRNVHFPSSADVAPDDVASAAPLGGTTVMEDSEAAVLGMPVSPRPETATPPPTRP